MLLNRSALYSFILTSSRCTTKLCRFDDQCNDQRLSCHPQGFCTSESRKISYVNVLQLCAPILVQLDYVEGRRLSRAHVKNKQSGLIEEAESIEDEKGPNLSQAQEEELERQVSKLTKFRK